MLSFITLIICNVITAYMMVIGEAKCHGNTSWTTILFNSLWPSDAIYHRRTWSSLVPINGLVPLRHQAIT